MGSFSLFFFFKDPPIQSAVLLLFLLPTFLPFDGYLIKLNFDSAANIIAAAAKSIGRCECWPIDSSSRRTTGLG